MHLLIILGHQHKAACRAWRLKLSKMQTVGTALSFNDHNVMERDRITPLSVEKWTLFPRFDISDGCNAPANFLCQFSGHVMYQLSPRQMRLEDVTPGKFDVLVNLVQTKRSIAAGSVRKPHWVFRAAMPRRTSNTGCSLRHFPETLTTRDRETAGYPCMDFFAVTGLTDRRTDDKNIGGVGLCTLANAGS